MREAEIKKEGRWVDGKDGGIGNRRKRGRENRRVEGYEVNKRNERRERKKYERDGGRQGGKK